jgi:uncharacterized protein YukE
MDEVKVNFPQLQQGSDDLNSAARALQASLDQMRTAAKPLVDIWVASGSPAAAQWMKADQDLQNLITGLSSYSADFSGRTQTAMANQLHNENVIQQMFV